MKELDDEAIFQFWILEMAADNASFHICVVKQRHDKAFHIFR